MAVFKAIAQSLSEPRTCVQQRHECKQIATTTAGIPISFDKQLICAAPLSLDNNINNSRSISLARADAAKINRRGFATAHASSPRICLYFKHLPHTLHGHISTGVIGGLWVLRYLLNAHYARALSHDVFFCSKRRKLHKYKEVRAILRYVLEMLWERTTEPRERLQICSVSGDTRGSGTGMNSGWSSVQKRSSLVTFQLTKT